jgi:hypothetical protein
MVALAARAVTVAPAAPFSVTVAPADTAVLAPMAVTEAMAWRAWRGRIRVTMVPKVVRVAMQAMVEMVVTVA